MNQEYQNWIDAQGGEMEVMGRCAELTIRMVKAFPELRRVRGHYHCPFWGRREHWWCLTPTGDIVDPAVAQFPSKGVGEYVLHVEGSAEPTGKCADCGEYTYNGDSFCSLECERATMESMGFSKAGDGTWQNRR